MPYWRLSAVYFCYFAVVGVISPYWGIYLEALGYAPAQIGLLSAIPMLTKLAAPNIWGALADVSGRRLQIIRLGAAGACVCFAGIFLRQDYLWLIIVSLSFSFFWNAILAQFEVVTLGYLKESPHRYSRIRLWGSVGFIATVVALGYLFELVDIRFLPVVIFFFLSGIFFSVMTLPSENRARNKNTGNAFISLLRQPRVWRFFLVLALLQLSHGVYYTFYSIYLESFGYSRGFIGVLWAIGVIAEIVVFLRMPELLHRFSLLGLLQLSLVLTALRWFVIGWFPTIVLLIVGIQLIHAFSFGVSHAVAIEFVRREFGERGQGQGQAFYSALCFGGGNAAGAYISGILWEVEPLWAFGFSVIAILIALLITRRC